MNHPAMESAILLPVYNHLDYTKATLKELMGYINEVSSTSFHVVLIDDGSTDGTSDWVQTNYPEVTILKGDGNLWWSGAINKGAKYAFEELHVSHVILWNNDIHTEKEYFKILPGILLKNSNTTILGSKILVAEQPGLVWSMGGYFNPKNGRYDMYGYFEKDSVQWCKIIYADWLTGMGTIVPKSAIDKIGYWDEVNFPQYHGDSDFTYKAKLKGFEILVDPSLKIYNSVKNSGIEHDGNFKKLLRLLMDIRSKSNIRKNFLFYRRYATSIWAYKPLIWLYFQILGGFIKWKILALFGIKSNKIKPV